MKRKTKNIIIIFCILILFIASYFTMNLAKNSVNNNSNSQINMQTNGNMNEQGGTPPSMPNGTDNNSNNNQGEPPAKPDGDDNTSENNQNTPPSMPNGTDNNSNNNQGEPPTKPDGDDNTSGNNQNTPPSMPGESNNASVIKIDTVYYILFGIEALVNSILIGYLLTSKFNKLAFRETIQGNRIIALIVVVIILTGILTFAQGYITTNYLITNNTNNVSMNNGMPGMENGSSSSVSYSSTKEVTEDAELLGGEYVSSEKDENALLVSGDIEVTATDIEVSKTGDSDGGDSSNFYGNNSGIIAKDGATLNLKDINVETNADGANGVFSYGGSATTNNASSDGTTVNISDSTITTTGDNAGGIMTTGGGTTNASDLTINTSGTSSAAIRSDRGGGTVNVDGGTYTTTGTGSPAIYSTADITVKNSDLISKASEGVVIEGKNSVSLEDCNLTDDNNKLNGQSTTYKNIFLYQSMSGDAADGNASFTAKDCTIITNNGDTLYVTNTTATINLENNDITNNDGTGNFLRIQKDSWGNSGSNGGNVTLNLTNQKAIGNIVVDSISTLNMNLKNNSYYEGTINGENQAENIALVLDSSSSIKLTGNSYVTSLVDADTTYSNIDFNGYTLYVNGVAIN